jgi:hypothetical protein
MKHISIIAASVAVIILSACGAQAAPTPAFNAQDVQNTAVAAAVTIVAQTQAAIPTATLLPPTDIPTETALPTDTPPALPTPEAVFTSAPVSQPSGGDPCASRVLSASPKGISTIISIVNTTKANITISLYLNETKSHGECGWRSYTLSKNGSVVISDLIQACYNLWAWSNDPKIHFNVASGTSCITSPQKWTFKISASTIGLTF